MPPVVVGIGGGSASGKTTVVERLVDALGGDRTAVIAHDRYYRDRGWLTAEARAALNYDHPDALETELLVAHLECLRAGTSIEVPVYDFARHARSAEREPLHPRPVIIVEGILALAVPSLRQLMDVKVFVDTDDASRLARRLARDVACRGRSPESVLRQYAATVRPMHEAFVEPSRSHADLVLLHGGFDDTGIQRLFDRVLKMLEAPSTSRMVAPTLGPATRRPV